MAFVYVPNGIIMDHWTPGNAAVTGPLPQALPRILQPVAAFRDQFSILSGLTHNGGRALGDGPGDHARAGASYLTGVHPKKTSGADIQAGVSIDQVAAARRGSQTRLPSLELGCDEGLFGGNCDSGYSCSYSNTISWRTPSAPMPQETSPRAVFERLFGDSGSTDPAIRKARLARDASLLDSVTDRAANLSRELGAHDRVKLSQYLDGVRDIERRIQMAEAQSDRELPVVAQPAGIPGTVGEHAKLMFDLLALAYETDLTRVTTFMMGREITGRTYAEIGVPDAHHPISHHQRDPAKLVKLEKINQYHVQLFSAFLERLRETPDGDGSLLDHSMIVYGAGMGDSNSHASKKLPILLAGGGVGSGGRHTMYPEDTPLANLHLSLLDKMGVPIDTLGHSTGRLPLEPLSVG
jgi:hypothetical protein